MGNPHVDLNLLGPQTEEEVASTQRIRERREVQRAHSQAIPEFPPFLRQDVISFPGARGSKFVPKIMGTRTTCFVVVRIRPTQLVIWIRLEVRGCFPFTRRSFT